MAVDKLVDSTQLNADLTSVANAIRTKGGTSADLAFPAGFVSAVNAIPQGDENIAKLAGPTGTLAYRWFRGVFDVNEDFAVDVSGIINQSVYGQAAPDINNAFDNARQLKSITLTGYENFINQTITAINMSSFACKDGAYGSYQDNLEKIKIEAKTGSNYNTYIKVSSSPNAFVGRTKLKEIDCIFDLSNVPYYSQGYNFRDMFKNCSALEEVRFAPNSILWMSTSYQILNVSQVFSDASLVSIANALAVDSVAPNLKLLSTPYARCSTLMGTVTDGFFTQDDENGTVSLADFIADTKGWTLST